MSYTISWYIPDRVIHIQFYSTVGIEDVEQVQLVSAHYLAEGIAPVHLLVDMTGLEHYPKNISELKNALQPSNSSNVGWIIIINQNPVLKFFSSVIIQLSGTHRYRLFDHLEDGLIFLQERDLTLEIMLPN